MSRLIDQFTHHVEHSDKLGEPVQEFQKTLLDPKTPMRRRELVPRSTTQPSTRRVRRLDGEKLAATNPLLQPWTTESSKKVLDFSRNISPRKVEPKMKSRPELIMGEALLVNRKQTRQGPNTTLLNSTLLGTTFSDNESSSSSFSEIDMGDVTLPASLQLTSQPTEFPQRMARLKHDNCLTILEDATPREMPGPDSKAQIAEVEGSKGTEEVAIDYTIFPLSPRDMNTRRQTNDIMRPKFTQETACAMDSAEKENTDATSGAGIDEDILPEQLVREQCRGNELRNDRGILDTSTTATTVARKFPTSPRKARNIPQGPHTPTKDDFWRQSLVDCWNDEHSPRKATKTALRSPIKQSGPSKPSKILFEAQKATLAIQFLEELDCQITNGRIAELSRSTGGVKIEWLKTLNTTAGRANWKKETVRMTPSDGSDAIITYSHHASIELAEKVIDDESKLLNVLAHEFCHLANFMISGITNNPHGKEFKHWAEKCSQTFASRGIKVTTKHSYQIDFKYVWQCGGCSCSYKRHSKSINPEKHRCGGCQGKLVQIKPVPRNGGKPSEYQLFIKDEMKALKREDPSSPQKVIMQMAAERWARRSKPAESQQAKEDVRDIAAQLLGLSLGE
ncbi:SprT family metallopeptidase, putative [Cordyceps militaris CM01]|uniref:SprT family metallopeptidase, putative n=2 Tax=Cordyceps militaris TaxID=73501 RepID=G3J3K1_CORMM|nr:SprT family metallopeptidase, putative [Cordyceps militaris CM01]ATY64848.1 SprT family metallopeptidase, putative [Cordyceps militaris]EGX96529.1 SprT family metallopeptidase, putative [Cordyceps militaris CM01]